MDSMVEIFYEESTALINEMCGVLREYKDCQSYNAEFIQKIFRGIHTMKADSTMMLLDTIGALSKVFESLLYFFRNNKLEITDKEYFDKLLVTYLDYVSEEIEKLSRNEQLNTEHIELEDEIKEYLDKLKKEYKGGIAEEKKADTETYEKEDNVKGNHRQVYYIASAESNGSTVGKKSEEHNVSEKKFEQVNDNVVLVKQKDIDSIYNSIRRYSDFLNNLESRFNGDEPVEINHNDFITFKDFSCELLEAVEHFTKSDFTAVAKKMELLVDEMSAALKKPVKLIVRGEKTLVDKSKREKISSALVHIIRNAVDHGIENSEVRERAGKSPMGIIRLVFENKNGKLIISVEDDGVGIDRNAVLASAEKNNFLKKPAEEYTDDEIINLLFISGVSTAKRPNDYSGRGVGMDVINHNVISLGGKLNIESNYGYGTKVIMTF